MQTNILYVLVILLLSYSPVAQTNETRLKDIVTIKGVRDNPLIGYGLVVGLNGTGDGGGEITLTSLKRMFQKLGLNPQKELSAKNVAAVIVTANMQPFSRVGQKLDATISSIGDASSLAGGTLLVTPLKGGDGNVYGIASGAVSIGGLTQGKRFATSGLISNGVVVEKEISLEFHKKKSIRFNLNNPDFTTAARLEKIINENLGGKYAKAKDSSTIDLIIPTHYERNVIQMMAVIENFKVVADQKAKIVINEKTGTIVAGGTVVIKEVAISHGDLSVEIVAEGENASGPKKFHHVKKGTTLNQLVTSLNALGAGPDDLINIFKALKQNNALIADLEFI